MDTLKLKELIKNDVELQRKFCCFNFYSTNLGKEILNVVFDVYVEDANDRLMRFEKEISNITSLMKNLNTKDLSVYEKEQDFIHDKIKLLSPILSTFQSMLFKLDFDEEITRNDLLEHITNHKYKKAEKLRFLSLIDQTPKAYTAKFKKMKYGNFTFIYRERKDNAFEKHELMFISKKTNDGELFVNIKEHTVFWVENKAVYIFSTKNIRISSIPKIITYEKLPFKNDDDKKVSLLFLKKGIEDEKNGGKRHPIIKLKLIKNTKGTEELMEGYYDKELFVFGLSKLGCGFKKSPLKYLLAKDLFGKQNDKILDSVLHESSSEMSFKVFGRDVDETSLYASILGDQYYKENAEYENVVFKMSNDFKKEDAQEIEQIFEMNIKI